MSSEEVKVEEDLQSLYRNIHDSLHADDLISVHEYLLELHPAEAALLLESLPLNERKSVWELIEQDQIGEILTHLSDGVRATLISTMAPEDLVYATEKLDTDDLADIIPEMPEDVIQRLLNALDEQNRARLESVLSYDEDSAGGMMNVDAITIRADISLDVVLRYLRRLGTLPSTTDHLMVVDRDGKFIGLLSIATLLTQDPVTTVSEIMDTSAQAIDASTPSTEVASLFEKRDLVTAPVVDSSGFLMGRITIDDVVDVIRDKADQSFLGMAGMNQEEDLFAPIIHSSRRRAVWLGINLLTAFLAAWVIGLFGATIEHFVALAILMPIVASMGGIAGSQTLTLMIRAMALGQVNTRNARKLLIKEVAVGLLNGVLWSIVIAIAATLWFEHVMLGVVIAIAIIVNLFTAAFSGAMLPLLLKRLGIDPALAGSVILTTITDVVGFFAFLGLATIMLMG